MCTTGELSPIVHPTIVFTGGKLFFKGELCKSFAFSQFWPLFRSNRAPPIVLEGIRSLLEKLTANSSPSSLAMCICLQCSWRDGNPWSDVY